MTPFLDDLERELREAHPRRRAARRRAAAARAAATARHAALPVLAVVAGGGLVVALAGEDEAPDGAGPAATSPTAPTPKPPGRGTLTVVLADPSVPTTAQEARRGEDVRQVLAGAYAVGGKVVLRRRVVRTRVEYAREDQAQTARVVAAALGGVPVRQASPEVREVARSFDVAVVVGYDLRVRVTRLRDARGRRTGTAAVLRVGSTGRRVLAVVAGGPPGRRYALWLQPGDAGARFLGFLPPVGRDRQLRGIAPLPDDADLSAGGGVLVTRERADRPRRPSYDRTVLTGDLPLP